MTLAKKAGTYELRSFKIYKLNEPGNFLELKNVIATWELTESMNSGHIYGSAYVIDSVAILDKFLGEQNGWMKGEEEVEIVYTDFYGQIEMKHRCFVYSITNVKQQLTSNETTFTYSLHFVSIDKFFTERTMLRRSFSGGLISDYVQTVFDEYYVEANPDAKIEIQSTEGNQTLVVPNYSPEQTMHFFSRKAYSADDLAASNTWRFFQNRDQHYFTTHDNLVFEPIGDPSGSLDEIILYSQLNAADQTSAGQLLLMQNIIDIEFPQHINTINDMVEGGYYRSTTELNILNRLVSITEYRHLDDYENYILPNNGPGGSNVSGVTNDVRSKHSKKFVDEHLNYYRDNLVIQDYPYLGSTTTNFHLRPHPYYNRIYNNKKVNFYHHSNEMITMRVYGRNDVKAGSLVAIQLLETNADLRNRKLDNERSGVYLIETIRNVFDQDTFYQIINMSKSGYNGEKEPAINYNREPQVINSTTEATDSPTAGASGAAASTVNESSIVDASVASDGGVTGAITNVPTTGVEFTEIVTPRGTDENGNQYIEVRLANGVVERRIGSRNWRNNNPGNLEYGPFAQSMGAIGTDGRFAIFPSYEAGRRAKEELLFNTSSYRNLTLSEAINRYAPTFENDTKTYINTVAGRTGVNPNTRMSDIPLETRSQLLDAFEDAEGFKEGTITTITGSA